MQRNIRLWVDQKISAKVSIALKDEQSHYLTNVMRCNNNDTISCFNQNDGEYLAKIISANKSKTILEILQQTAKPHKEMDIWLMFAPLKKDRTDFVIEKAVELGVAKILPIITERTNSSHIKTERFVSQAIEASEQCGRLSVPNIAQPADLYQILNHWDENRILYFMDERRNGSCAEKVFRESGNKPCAILIGPEGGFSDKEAEFIHQITFVKNIQLGPRILRAETAAMASLAVWQAVSGDWQNKGVIDENTYCR